MLVVVLQKNLRLLSTAKRSNQSISMVIEPDLRLKGQILEFSDHIMGRYGSLEKDAASLKIEGCMIRGRPRTKCYRSLKYNCVFTKEILKMWWKVDGIGVQL